MDVLIIRGTGLISTGITRELGSRGHNVDLYNRNRRQVDIPEVGRITGDRNDHAAFEAQMVVQLVFCSTVDVYTKPAARYPVREDATRKPSPSFPYAFRKAQCERTLEDAHARGDSALTTIRPAWTYREGGSMLHTFGWNTAYLDRLRRGKPAIVHGDGTSL